MSKLSGWSLFWIALTVTCIIATVFSVIQAKRKKKQNSDQVADAGNVISADIPLVFPDGRTVSDGVAYIPFNYKQ